MRQGLALKVAPAAKRYLIDKGYTVKFGARPLRRVIEDEVEHAIAEGVLANSYQKGDILEVVLAEGAIAIERRSETETN